MPKVILTSRCHQSHSSKHSRQNDHSSKYTRQIGNSSKWIFAKTVSRQISPNQTRTARSTVRDKFNPPSGRPPFVQLRGRWDSSQCFEKTAESKKRSGDEYDRVRTASQAVPKPTDGRRATTDPGSLHPLSLTHQPTGHNLYGFSK